MTFDLVIQSLTHRPQGLRQLDGFFPFSHSSPSADNVGADQQKASLLFFTKVISFLRVVTSVLSVLVHIPEKVSL